MDRRTYLGTILSVAVAVGAPGTAASVAPATEDTVQQGDAAGPSRGRLLPDGVLPARYQHDVVDTVGVPLVDDLATVDGIATEHGIVERATDSEFDSPPHSLVAALAVPVTDPLGVASVHAAVTRTVRTFADAYDADTSNRWVPNVTITPTRNQVDARVTMVDDQLDDPPLFRDLLRVSWDGHVMWSALSGAAGGTAFAAHLETDHRYYGEVVSTRAHSILGRLDRCEA